MKDKLVKACAVLVWCACLSTEVMALGDWGHGDPSHPKNMFRAFFFVLKSKESTRNLKFAGTNFKVIRNGLKFGPPPKEKDQEGGLSSEKERNISFYVGKF